MLPHEDHTNDAETGDESFSDSLYDGLTDDDFETHDLAFDDEDADDLAMMREALGSYKAETLRFAEQQSAAMPVPRASTAAALWNGAPRWVLAATVVAALGLATLVLPHHANTPVSLAAAPTTQTLSEDNKLLLSVDQALSATAAPTEEDLGLTAIPAHSTKRGRNVTN